MPQKKALLLHCCQCFSERTECFAHKQHIVIKRQLIRVKWPSLCALSVRSPVMRRGTAARGLFLRAIVFVPGHDGFARACTASCRSQGRTRSSQPKPNVWLLTAMLAAAGLCFFGGGVLQMKSPHCSFPVGSTVLYCTSRPSVWIHLV